MAQRPLHYRSLSELSREIHAGRLSPVTLTEALLSRISALDERLHAFSQLIPERALAEARAAEAAIRGGRLLGPLHGIPYAAKDLFDVAGMPTTAGSRLLRGNMAVQDSAVTQRLAEAGMVLLGKTHMVEFAYGGAGINHVMGTPHNPWHSEPHLPGGSSSGSGVAVAAGLAPMALGSDTGGSVRIPAALNGITGLKTTVGRVSRHGVFPLSYTLDSVGPLARTVADAALVFQVLQGVDPRDATTRGVAPVDALAGLQRGVQGMRLGIAEGLFWEDVDAQVGAAVREAAALFTGLGATVTSIEVPAAAEAMALNRRGNVIAAEAYAIHRERIADHADEIDPIVLPRILLGRDMVAADYIDVVRAWTRLREEALTQWDTLDALLVPTTAAAALPLSRVDGDLETYMTHNVKYLRNTAVGNILDWCGLSVPCGFTDQGLPIGLMIYGRPFAEATVLRIGQAYQEATEWHLRTPQLDWAGEDARPPTG
jgi:aspartyl-tRNA(Asn)/glutamyl-tRNA(Gln) amidotransferase subunit A